MKEYKENVRLLRLKAFKLHGIYPFGILSPEYYAGHMDHEIVEKFVRYELPRLKADSKVFNAARGRFNTKMVAALPSGIPYADLTICEKKLFRDMQRRGQAGMDVYGRVLPDCRCKWCCASGMTCTQYRWNRLIDKW